MISHIIFDLDGVLVDAKHIHFNALNEALFEKYGKRLTDEEQWAMDGMPTYSKLKKIDWVDKKDYKEVNSRKQAITAEMFNELKRDDELIYTLDNLKCDRFTMSVASNSRRNTVAIALKRLGIDDYFSVTLSNDDVFNPKPSPEIYYKCMLHNKIWIPETIVIEDSDIGINACKNGGLKYLPVQSRKNVTYENISNFIEIIY